MSASELPPHLATLDPQGLIEGERIAQFELGTMRNFVYLVLDPATKKAAIVDPQKDIDTPLTALAAHGYTLEFCLLTHTHHDHVAGIPALIERFPALPIFTHEADRPRLAKWNLDSNLRLLKDGERFSLGSLKLEALHTPGHSPGEICYRIPGNPDYLLTGDTLFIRDCGATHFEGGSDEELFASLQRLKKLPPKTVILPGHHYAPECASLLSLELERSPPLKCRTAQELAQLA